VTGSVRATNLNFTDALRFRNSDEFKEMEQIMQQELGFYTRAIFNSWSNVFILGFRNGSVITDYKVDVGESPDNKDITPEDHKAMLKFQMEESENKYGFDPNQIVIVDPDECLQDSLNDCHQNADCINEKLSFSCRCKEGFVDGGDPRGDGRLCLEEKEDVTNLTKKIKKVEAKQGKMEAEQAELKEKSRSQEVQHENLETEVEKVDDRVDAFAEKIVSVEKYDGRIKSVESELHESRVYNIVLTVFMVLVILLAIGFLIYYFWPVNRISSMIYIRSGPSLRPQSGIIDPA
jgi:hypothetical protein